MSLLVPASGSETQLMQTLDEELVLSGDVVLNTAFPVRLADPDTGEVVADVHYHPEFNHWHQMPLLVPESERVRYTVLVRDRDGQRVPLGPDGELAVEVEPAGDTPRDVVDIEVTGEQVDLRGLRPGTGDLVFGLVDGDERVWQGSLLSVSVEN